MRSPRKREILTRADIRAIAAKIYEPQPRVWDEHGWHCPQCSQINGKVSRECRCGISRDGLPEFCEFAKDMKNGDPIAQIRWYSVRLSSLRDRSRR